MLATLSILAYKRADVTRQFLRQLETTLHNRRDVCTIVRDNGSNDNGETEQAVFSCGIRNLVYVKSENKGFGLGHNANLEMVNGSEFMVVMNNDIFLHDHQWLERILVPLQQDLNVGLVGLAGAPCSLRPDGSGFVGRDVDYVEASLLAGRVEDFRRYGLFSPVYEKFYCEDSDISLRYKQMGKRLAAVPIAHQHLQHQSLNIVDKAFKDRIFAKNVDRFRRKWGNYLNTRQFSNRILVKLESLGIGDIISMSGVVEGIRKDHPTAHIEVMTSHPSVFVGNKHLTELYEMKRQYSSVGYDRIIDVKPQYARYELIAQQAEEIAVTKLSSYKPQLYLSKLEIREGQKLINSVREHSEQLVVGVHTQMSREIWQGRNWGFQNTSDLLRLLSSLDIKTIEFGQDTQSTRQANLDLTNSLSLREYFAAINSLDLFITIDSLGLHVASAFGTPTLCLFGSTSPLARVVDWSHIFPLQSDLPCVSCYQRAGVKPPHLDTCICSLNDPPGHESCMQSLTPQYVFEVLQEERDIWLQRNVEFLQKHMRSYQQGEMP